MKRKLALAAIIFFPYVLPLAFMVALCDKPLTDAWFWPLFLATPAVFGLAAFAGMCVLTRPRWGGPAGALALARDHLMILRWQYLALGCNLCITFLCVITMFGMVFFPAIALVLGLNFFITGKIGLTAVRRAREEELLDQAYAYWFINRIDGLFARYSCAPKLVRVLEAKTSNQSQEVKS